MDNAGCFSIIGGIIMIILLTMAAGYLLHVGWAAYTPGP